MVVLTALRSALAGLARNPVLFAVAVVVLAALFSAFFTTSSVAFYRGIASRATGSGAVPAAG